MKTRIPKPWVIDGDVATVFIPRGGEMLVDVDDLFKLDDWTVRLDSHGYCQLKRMKKKKTYYVLFHRMIMNAPRGVEVDHINRNRLDNRKANLRLVTRSENQLNKSLRADSKSGVTGVSWCNTRQRWVVNTPRVLGVGKYLGQFDELQDAIDCLTVYVTGTEGVGPEGDE